MQAHLEAIGRAVASSSHELLILDKVGWHTTRKHTERYTELSPDRFAGSIQGFRAERAMAPRLASFSACSGAPRAHSCCNGLPR